MFRNFLFGLTLVFVSTSMALAQCNCGSCDAAPTMPIGTDYTSVSSCGSPDCGGNCAGDCGASVVQSSCGDNCGSDCYGSGRCCEIRCRYFSIFGGWNGIDSFKQINLTDDSQDVNRGGFDDGEAFGMAIGTQVHPNLRFELEGTYRDNDVDSWTIEDFTAGVVTSSLRVPAAGSLESYSGMVNVLFDFPRRQAHCWNFYGGAGIGLISVNGTIVTATDVYDVNDESFAFQAIAGVNKGLSQRVDFFTEYRFLTAQHIFVDNLTTGIPLGDMEYNSNSVLFGLRFRQ